MTRTVRFVNAAQRLAANEPARPFVDASGGWEPDVILGAPATHGLALPAASPTASWLYAPRGVHLGRFRGRDVVVAADTGNHRVLIWHGYPERDEQPCDVVVGQHDATSEGPACGSEDTRRGLYLPTGVLVHEDRLIVADAWHHRVLIYSDVPSSPDAVPEIVLGQADLDQVEPNRGGECAAASMYWPFGVGVVNGTFYVADTGNRRVLGWSGGVPNSSDVEADLVLGQPDAKSREENRGDTASASSFRWPHGVCGSNDRLLVADAGNHRVLGWTPHPLRDQPANIVLGQADFTASTEWPYAPQRAAVTRFPYAIDNDGDRLAVADTANNRILLWDELPAEGIAKDADVVLGQPSFSANGENRWASVTRDSLCWPYGLSLSGDRLAIADSGNNRVVLWKRR